ncbi:hypothetical protein CTI12_AA203180 [Artemisia annua]|uniref:Uncharacterized protein n=1 Tax=Artemisia annua TaxID=35608 RepID=A0A2U1P203_ARTAN|nr:hypothetical protein CTI12_AA203180 [Artemisia annua]
MAGMVVNISRLITTNHTTLIPKFNNNNNIHHINLPVSHSQRPSTIIMSSATTPTTITTITPTPSSSESGCSWAEFAGNVSGEWDGFLADFTIDGKPIELPENVVPNAYREWEVQVFDWQTQCPTLAQPDKLSAMYKVIKLLPTVGCEADAATRYTIDERTVGGVENMVSAFAYQSNGSYTAVWENPKGLELEHCLIDPRDKESRVRIVQIVGVEDKKLVLKNIKVFVEQWYGPFRNGESLGGCAIRDSAFACTKALDYSLVSGVWQSSNSVAAFQDSPNGVPQELVPVDGKQNLVREEANLVLLPKNLWSSVTEMQDEGITCCEVGWLLEPGRAITSKCIFSRNAELKEIVMSSETASPGPGL